MTREELEEIKKKRLLIETPAPQARAPVERVSLMDEVTRGLKRGVVTGPTSLGDVVGLATEYGLKQAGAPQDLNLPSMTQAADQAIGLPQVTTPIGRIAEGVSGGATLGAPGGPAGIGLGAVAGGLGAVGVETAKLFTDNPWIQTAAGLAGGLSSGLAMRGVEAAGKTVGSFNPIVRRKVLQNSMEKNLAAQIPDMDAVMQAAKEAQGLAQRIPGYQPALAEVSPAAQSASRMLRKADAGVAARQNTRSIQNIEALVEKADDLAKSFPVGTPESARAALRNREQVMREAEQTKLDKTHESFTEALKPIRETVGDLPNPAEFGGKIRNTINQVFEQQKAQLDEQYKTLSLGVRVDPSPSVEALRALESGIKKAEADALPSIFVRDLVRNLGRQKVNLGRGQTALGPRGAEPLDELLAIRSRLLSEIRKEHGENVPNDNKIRLSNQLLDGIQANIDQAIEGTPNAALNQINADYKAFMQKFKSEPINQVLAVTRQGVEKKSDRSIFNEFSNLSAGKGADQFRALQEAVGIEQARTIYGEALMAKMLLSPGVRNGDGTFNPKVIQKFIDTHSNLLRDLPDLQKPLMNLKQAADDSLKAPKKVPDLADFDSTVARKLMGDYPDEAIKLIVKSGNMTDALGNLKQAFGGQPAVERSMSRALWDALLDESGRVRGSLTTEPQLKQWETMGELLQKNEKPLRAFYGDKHYEGLVDIQRAARLASESPRRIDAGYTQHHADLSKILTTMWSRSFGIARGVIGPQFASAELLSRRMANLIDAFDEKEVRIIMDNMLHDKNLVETLTKVKNVKDIMEAKRGLKRWLKTNVIPTVGVTGQQVFDGQRSTSGQPR